MKTTAPYFTRKGIIFKPASKIGWLVLIACGLYGIYALFEIDKASHSGSDTFMSWFLTMVMLAVGYTIFAYLMNEKDKDHTKGSKK